jgi:hypothetical protein
VLCAIRRESSEQVDLASQTLSSGFGAPWLTVKDTGAFHEERLGHGLVFLSPVLTDEVDHRD